ncbi:hypothetical protein PVAND_013356 [Polypedilum vanderplanki]|uniref:DNL-type domain-containing protein n=1 Tax=Polypedilum vanderplanki TaxID=319348 RepID=A0A9J6CQG2_POLVA|nr:hypothetical protein PVAND_013356 [Polypedilum vanderplanki]
MLTASRHILRRSLFINFQKILQSQNQHQIPQIPFWKTTSRNFCDEQSKQALGQIHKQKFYLEFTCKKCTTRSAHFISQLAYKKGVVIVKCPGCKNNHLIADNLKWFRDENTNIEDLLREKGELLQKTVDNKQVIELLRNEDLNKS